MLAAALARGETVIENAAREPEIADLAAMLTAMGALVEGAGTSTIRIQGQSRLKGLRHHVVGDRIGMATHAPRPYTLSTPPTLSSLLSLLGL